MIQGGLDAGKSGTHFFDNTFFGRRAPTRSLRQDVQRGVTFLPSQLWDFGCRCSSIQCSSIQREPEDDARRGDNRTLVVVGGGAAGVFGALRAKTLHPSLEVVVLEKGQRLLSKVLISGGGRCNVTTGLFNNEPSLLAGQYPRGHKELRGSYFHRHGPRDTAAWFVSRGVALKTERDGRMFPKSNSSATIVECLLSEARRMGVALQTSAQVHWVSKERGKFSIHIGGGGKPNGKHTLEANNVLLATGSAIQGYKIASQLGHSIVEPRPSLFTFKVKDTALTELSGVSFEKVKVELELPDHKKLKDPHLTQDGPLLITHWGFSGPVVLRLSAWAARLLYSSGYEGTIWVDFLPNLGLEETKSMLVNHKQECQKRNLGSFVPAEIPLVRRFWLYLLQRQGLDKDSKWARLSTQSLYNLAVLIKRCSFEISGKGEFKDEFVTAGGVPLVEVDLKTMESRMCPGLFLAGEVLDVDGITGGFNFQNAWTGGYIAGTTIAEQTRCDHSIIS
ncbi:unnamed protein product [Calypogeia fissa]